MVGMHPMFRKWLVVFLALLLAGAGATAGAVGGLIGYLHAQPPLDALERYAPPEITRVFDRSGNRQVAEFFSERREVVRYQDIPEHVVNAFIAIEDERFGDHFGIDFEGLGRVAVLMATGKRMQGASTISMQVARNIVLNDLSRNAGRKFREMGVALQMERDFSKEQIVTFYMNHIFLGANSYGVQAAAKSYFDKDVKDLTVPEAAMIAGLPKAPSQYNPFRNKEKAKQRRDQVMFNMIRPGFLKDYDEYSRYRDTPIVLNPAPRAKFDAEYFVNYLGQKLVDEEGKRNVQELGEKGMNVISTVDLTLQTILEEELSKGLRDVEKEIELQKPSRLGKQDDVKGHELARILEVRDRSIVVSARGQRVEVDMPAKLPYFNPSAVVKVGNLIDVLVTGERKNGRVEAVLYDKTHVQGAAVLLDPRTGEILALVGGDDYNDPVNNGQWNRAVQGGRQPGSCWKPLLYASSFDVNNADGKPKFTPGTVMIDDAYSVGNWSPKNYENKHFGPTALCEALAKSRNIPTVKLFMGVGAKQALELYRRFNVVNGPQSWKLTPDPPMCLGTANVTPLELAGSYASFANLGVGITPTPYKRLFSAKSPGESTLKKPEEHRVLSPEAAYMTTSILKNVLTQGTAKATVGKWITEQKSKGRALPEMAGKTGTTNNCYCAWLSGYTPDLVLTVYIGYDQHRSMGTKIVGGKNVGPIWAAMIDRILKTRPDWRMKFDVPPGVALRDVCGKSGQLAGGGCGEGALIFKDLAFKRGTEPTSGCSYHGGGGRHRDDDEADPEAHHAYEPSAEPDAPGGGPY